ncbi:hypothetical protein [Alkalinema sp. FACHB-956]|uniref:hypothetical protein n=1 Tax=Alkalinema sp. FACHB-956 TaxID=2692768 RepID=UPI001689A181|nr:hypothetical protein [Alkalinema sp. FACHB-956]MBD2329516.1 hypothetical protein [Alkalinema sp. FACHB-956]
MRQKALEKLSSWGIFTIATLTIVILEAMTLQPAVSSPVMANSQPIEDTSITKLKESEKESDEFWVPAARVDIQKPAKIQLVNKTPETLEYLITTHTNFRRLAPGQTVTLSDFQPPVFININSLRDSGNVEYSVTVDKKTNTATVDIKPTIGQGNRTLNLDKTGAIYLY